MDALGVLAHLAADDAPGERMVRIAGDGRQPAVVDLNGRKLVVRPVGRDDRERRQIATQPLVDVMKVSTCGAVRFRNVCGRGLER